MNTDEYLNQIHRIIRDNFRSTDPSGGMPVATIAYLAKQAIGSDHARFGFLKFRTPDIPPLIPKVLLCFG